MNKYAKIGSFIAGILTLISACTDHNDGATTFDQLLEAPPYTALTGSNKKDPKQD